MYSQGNPELGLEINPTHVRVSEGSGIWEYKLKFLKVSKELNNKPYQVACL